MPPNNIYKYIISLPPNHYNYKYLILLPPSHYSYKNLILLPPMLFFKYNFTASILSLIGRNSADSWLVPWFISHKKTYLCGSQLARIFRYVWFNIYKQYSV